MPAVALVVGLLLTLLVRVVAGNYAGGIVQEQFDGQAATLMDDAEDDVRAYLDRLRTFASYVAADSDGGADVEIQRFRALVRVSGLLDQVVGAQGVGYLQVLGDGRFRLAAVASEVPGGRPGGAAPAVSPTLDAALAGADAGSAAPVVVDLATVAAELASGAGAEGLEASDALQVLAASFGTEDGTALVPAAAVPVVRTDGTVGAFVVGELLPHELFGRVTDVPDALGVRLALVEGDGSIPLSGVELTGRGAERTFRLEGLTWSVRVTAPSSLGAGTVTRAEQLGTLGGLVLALAAVALLRLRGRSVLRTRDIRQELGATQVEARRDPLTGLVNRAGFMENLERSIRELDQAHRFVAVLFVDVDRLKVINDSLGHSIGDLALVEIGRRFGAIGRWTDTVARFGGDEFVLLCSGLQQASDSVRVAEQVLLSLAQPIPVDEMELVMTASIGVAVASVANRTDAESLVRDADTAMYEAKAAGGNRIVLFDDGLRVKVTGRLEVERSLRSAVDNGELDVHFQPIVDARTGSIVSAEALVRWFPREGGSISPGVFMPVASETGLVVQIGDFVLQQACVLAAELERTFPGIPPISIAVNVAERQLLDAGFVNRVRLMSQGARIWPHQITLEITEDVMIDRLGRSLEVLRKLADIGFGLAIDDFGTGMSSLSYVKRLDMVKTLKIDRAFVTDVVSDPADRAIVSSVVAMARTLGVNVVAEGVEQPEQADVLRHLGVHRMQGFLWSKAVPAAEFRDLVRRVMGPSATAPPDRLSRSASAVASRG